MLAQAVKATVSNPGTHHGDTNTQMAIQPNAPSTAKNQTPEHACRNVKSVSRA